MAATDTHTANRNDRKGQRMNAKRITREGNGGFIVVRMTESEARDLLSNVEGWRKSAAGKLRATLRKVDGDTLNEKGVE